MQKITTFLTYDGDAEQAVALYTSIFPGSRIVSEQRYGPHGPGPEGSLMTAEFELFGQPFMALNGGPTFEFSEGISLFVDCENQAEVDRYWDALVAGGGRPSKCGWLVDPFGVSWQIIPRRLGELINDPDPERAGRAMGAMLEMEKIDVATLERAAAGA